MKLSNIIFTLFTVPVGVMAMESPSELSSDLAKYVDGQVSKMKALVNKSIADLRYDVTCLWYSNQDLFNLDRYKKYTEITEEAIKNQKKNLQQTSIDDLKSWLNYYQVKFDEANATKDYYLDLLVDNAKKVDISNYKLDLDSWTPNQIQDLAKSLNLDKTTSSVTSSMVENVVDLKNKIKSYFDNTRLTSDNIFSVEKSINQRLRDAVSSWSPEELVAFLKNITNGKWVQGKEQKESLVDQVITKSRDYFFENLGYVEGLTTSKKNQFNTYKDFVVSDAAKYYYQIRNMVFSRG